MMTQVMKGMGKELSDRVFFGCPVTVEEELAFTLEVEAVEVTVTVGADVVVEVVIVDAVEVERVISSLILVEVSGVPSPPTRSAVRRREMMVGSISVVEGVRPRPAGDGFPGFPPPGYRAADTGVRGAADMGDTGPADTGDRGADMGARNYR